MPEQTDLRKIERNAYLAYFQDGIWDILLGIALLTWGLLLGSPMLGVAGAWFAMIVPVGWALKRRITHPRLGQVRFSQERKARERKINLRLIAIGTATALLGVVAFLFRNAGAMPDIIGDYMLVFFATLIGIPAALVGYWQNLPRLYGYGLVIVLAPLAVRLAEGPDRLGFIISGSLVTAAGLVLLARFLLRHTRHADGESRGV
jgi:hypothetical protein